MLYSLFNECSNALHWTTWLLLVGPLRCIINLLSTCSTALLFSYFIFFIMLLVLWISGQSIDMKTLCRVSCSSIKNRSTILASMKVCFHLSWYPWKFVLFHKPIFLQENLVLSSLSFNNVRAGMKMSVKKKEDQFNSW